MSAGAAVDYHLSDRWSLRSRLYYQNIRVDGSFYKEQFNYLAGPITANWHFGKTRKWNVNFGTSVGFLTRAKVEGPDTNENLLDKNKKVMFNLVYGGASISHLTVL